MEVCAFRRFAMSDQRAQNSDRRANGFRNLVEKSLFTFVLDLEVQKAIRLQYCVSVICLTPDHRLPKANSSLAKQIAERALRQLRGTDLATILSPSSIAILLIDAETATLPTILNRIKEELEARPVTIKGREWRLRWRAGGGCYPMTVTGGRELLRQAIELMTRAKRERVDRLYLPS